jgi:hypothetical protein
MGVPAYVFFLDRTCKIAKYVFLAATTGLSVFSLVNETTLKTDGPSSRKMLTEAGRWYLSGVVTLAILTITVAVIGDWADGRIDRDAKENFQANLKEELHRKNIELIGEFEPNLIQLKQNILDTSNDTKTKLIEQSKQSSAELASAQNQLLDTTKESSANILELQSKVSAGGAKLLESVLDSQRIQEEATQPVHALDITVVLTDSSRPVGPDAYDWAATQATAKAMETRVCSNTPHSQYYNDVDHNFCDATFQKNKMWEDTHKFAEQLFPGVGFSTFLTISLRSFSLQIVDTDCGLDVGLLQPRMPPIPCARTSLSANQADASGKRDGPPISVSSNFLPGTGVKLAAFSSDINSNFFKTNSLVGRDVVFEDLKMTICPGPTRPAQAGKPEDVMLVANKAPKSMQVIVGVEDTKRSHTYNLTFDHTAPSLAISCADVFYSR